MISPKKLIKMARKWQRMAALRRRRISWTRISRTDVERAHDHGSHTTRISSSFTVGKGRFVVYTTDDMRFVMPLSYLKHDIMRKLFKMSEEAFGLSSDGPIRLPCDSVFMDYVATLIRRGVAKDLEKALLRSMDDNSSCSLISSSLREGLANQKLLVCGY